MILFRESHPHLTYALDLPEQPAIGPSKPPAHHPGAHETSSRTRPKTVESAAENAEPGWSGASKRGYRIVGNRFEIEVVDNGIGLPKQNRSRLLEPYCDQQGHQGTVLGLAIVQKIVSSTTAR